jgi:hypothetical protein
MVQNNPHIFKIKLGFIRANNKYKVQSIVGPTVTVPIFWSEAPNKRKLIRAGDILTEKETDRLGDIAVLTTTPVP